MPPRNPELPEGTDHIINGAMATTNDAGTETGSGGGFVGSAGADDTGGTTAGSSNAPVKQQLRDSASSLRDQAGSKAREYAEDGKQRASTALEDFSRVVSEAADSIDERLGEQYGRYARQAADAVSGYADTLRNKPVDELYDDARNLVRKSPAVAIGVAAAVGFALVRLVKAGMPEGEGERDVNFTPDPSLGTDTGGTTGASSAGGPATGA
jgi:ElaB/YqjD/DUF883 family membrane-anchored ribosome-binding protein